MNNNKQILRFLKDNKLYDKLTKEISIKLITHLINKRPYNLLYTIDWRNATEPMEYWIKEQLNYLTFLYNITNDWETSHNIIYNLYDLTSYCGHNMGRYNNNLYQTIKKTYHDLSNKHREKYFENKN